MYRCWFDCGVQSQTVLTGLVFKQFIRGADVGIDMLAASILLLRSMESGRFLGGQRSKLRHYLDAHWGVGPAVVKSLLFQFVFFCLP